MRGLKFQPIHTSDISLPERNLIVQVLSYAIRDYLNFEKNYDIELIDHKNAEAWIYSPRNDAFSFAWICQNLGLSVSRVRCLLQQHYKNGIVWEIAA